MHFDLKVIKKKYGENMMKLCREFFPTILEQEGLLSQTILKHFEPSRELYNDIITNDLSVEFKNYIYNIIEMPEQIKEEVNKTPEELLDLVGYDLYECSSENEIQRFKKYYREDEKLCTFRGNRLDKCYVFFAVKKNVSEIKREHFENPQRQDLYGTSVISIQFTRDEAHTLSIKNRYNHTVPNPDATFSNNLDNIIQGLTESFEKYYGMSQKQKNSNFEIPNYVCAEGKYYKYNYEINNIYYCPNNIIIDNFEVYRLPKEKYLLFDYFILDNQSKKIELYDESLGDSFIDAFSDISKTIIQKNKNGKVITIKNDEADIIVRLDKDNKLIGYINENIKVIGDDFLTFSLSLQEIILPDVKIIGNNFLSDNESLQIVSLDKTEEIGDYFLQANNSLTKVMLPKARKVGCYCFNESKSLQVIFLPELKEAEEGIFENCDSNVTAICMPNLDEKSYQFLPTKLKELYVIEKQKGRRI